MKKKKRDIQKKVVAVLLVIAVILSLTATMTVLTKEKTTEGPKQSMHTSGTVGLVINPPVKEAAKVNLFVRK